MTRFLLDTTALYYASGVSAVGISARVRRLLEDPGTECFISAISITEIAIKSNKGLQDALSSEQAEQALDDLQLTVLPFSASHAFRLFGLPLHHGDPFDRMLIATALAEEMPIITTDAAFKKYKGLRVIW